MALPPIDYVTNIYGFISTSTSANNNQTLQNGGSSYTDFANDDGVTKLGRLLYQHTLILPWT